MNRTIKFTIGILILVCLSVFHLFAGSTSISLSDFYEALAHYDQGSTEHIIARDLRIPRLIITIVAGAGLSIAGLLMQTIFKNPLAEPNILGVSTGSSLFVALTTLSGISFFQHDLGIISSALLGAFIFGSIILFFTRFMKYQGSLLLIGIMLGSFSASIINVIQTYSDANQLKSFAIWSMGSMQQVTFEQLPFIILIFCAGFVLTFFLVRPLNALVLGDGNASMLGVNIKNTRFISIVITAIFAGLITAYCGPIAFIGMAVPNLVKMIFKTNDHLTLVVGNAIIGALFLLICDILVQLIAVHFILPINAVTSLIGAPFIIFIIIKRWS